MLQLFVKRVRNDSVIVKNCKVSTNPKLNPDRVSGH
jgi:hypothetical protein